jgi:hypothetical protein
MKTPILVLCFLSAAFLQAADSPRPVALDEVGGVVAARRAFGRMTKEEQVALVYAKSDATTNVRLGIQNSHLLVCTAGFTALFEKEVLVSKRVEHLRLTLQSGEINPAEARIQIKARLAELGVELVPAGDAILVLMAKENRPNKPVETTAMTPPPSTTPPAPSSHL